MADRDPNLSRLTLEFDYRDAPPLLEAIGHASLSHGYTIIGHENVDELDEVPDDVVPTPSEYADGMVTMVDVKGTHEPLVTEDNLRRFGERWPLSDATRPMVSRIVRGLTRLSSNRPVRQFLVTEPDYEDYHHFQRLIGIRAESMVPMTTALRDGEVDLPNVGSRCIDLLGDYCIQLYASRARQRRKNIVRLGSAARLDT